MKAPKLILTLWGLAGPEIVEEAGEPEFGFQIGAVADAADDGDRVVEFGDEVGEEPAEAGDLMEPELGLESGESFVEGLHGGASITVARMLTARGGVPVGRFLRSRTERRDSRADSLAGLADRTRRQDSPTGLTRNNA